MHVCGAYHPTLLTTIYHDFFMTVRRMGMSLNKFVKGLLNLQELIENKFDLKPYILVYKVQRENNTEIVC